MWILWLIVAAVVGSILYAAGAPAEVVYVIRAIIRSFGFGLGVVL